jgi:hypothetical protein
MPCGPRPVPLDQRRHPCHPRHGSCRPVLLRGRLRPCQRWQDGRVHLFRGRRRPSEPHRGAGRDPVDLVGSGDHPPRGLEPRLASAAVGVGASRASTERNASRRPPARLTSAAPRAHRRPVTGVPPRVHFRVPVRPTPATAPIYPAAQVHLADRQRRLRRGPRGCRRLLVPVRNPVWLVPTRLPSASARPIRYTAPANLMARARAGERA